MLTRIGEAGANAFTIMRIAGHSSVTVSRRQKLNAVKYEQAEAEGKAEAAGGSTVPAKVPTTKRDTARKSSQATEFKRTGP